MLDFGDLAYRLSEATDTPTAAERLAEYVQQHAPEAGVRVYICSPGVVSEASADRPFILNASVGAFGRPPGHVKEIPWAGTAWEAAINRPEAQRPEALPPELAPAADGPTAEGALLVPLEGGGETVGVVGVRAPSEDLARIEAEVRTAAFLTAACVRSLRSRITANRRFEQLLLVNELGRKVNAILNDELLLRQAAVDIHRTFGFHNVMIFMVDENRASLELKAQASGYANPSHADSKLRLGEGIIGRVYRTGQTESIDDVSEEADYVDWYSDTKSEMAVPIQIGGVVEGVLNVESDRVSAFGPSDKLVLETVANQLAIAIENARLFGMVKEREDRYRTLVESSPGGVLHLDTEGRIIYANPAVTAITGFEKGYILSRLSGLAELAVEADQESLTDAISGALRGLPCPDLDFHLLHADGSTRWISASLQPLIGDQGDPKGVVVLARDKTREGELQEKLSQSEKMSAIGRLVSGVAHELNNPLAGILGFAQLLLGRPPEQWTRQDIEKIEKNARRCQHIVENLLAFAKQSRIRKRHANINEVIDSVLNLNEYTFRMDNVEIVRDFDMTIPSFPIDVNRWQQVFVNMALNARQALLQSDATERRITFETRRDGSQVRIRVIDTGPGIPEHLRNRVFEPFFSTKGNDGTGLGLGICFGIVEEHGGTIALENPGEPGATFAIELPIRDAPDFMQDPSVSPAHSESTAGEGKHVLVVDDDTYVCDVVARAMQNHQYTVTIAHDGRQALERAAEAEYDVIVTDVRMPGDVDGIQLFDRLVAERPELEKRFVFMTGNLLDTRTMGRLEKLRVRFVEKPFDIHHLASIVNDIASHSTVGARPNGSA